MRNCLSIASGKNWWTFKTTGATTLATVVVVDDHSFIRKFLRTVQTARGHQVFDEGSGEDALALCAAVHPDILIAEHIAVADLQITAAGTVEFQILRLMSDDCAHVDLIVLSDLRVPREISVRPNPRPRANLHVLLDDHICPHLDG